MTTLVREPQLQVTTAERTSAARRRADRARQSGRSPEPALAHEIEPAPAPPRESYSIENIPANPPTAQVEQPAQPVGAGATVQPEATSEQAAAGQPAVRSAQLAAARSALENAQGAPGLMAAFAQAAPTVKAQVSGELGGRVTNALAHETQAIQQQTPEVRVDMPGNTPAAAGEIPTPAAVEVELEPNPPAPAPEPERLVGDPVATPQASDPNAQVVSQLRGAFNPESGASSVAGAIDSVQTTDPSIASSPGTPPVVPQSGETDPQRFQNQAGAANQHAQQVLAQQQQAAAQLPGAERVQLADVHEVQQVGDLAAPGVDEAPAPDGAQQYLQMNLAPDVQAAFDEAAGPSMQQSMETARSQVEQAASQRDQQHQAEVTRAQQQTTEAQSQAEASQRTQVQDARQQIEQQRQETRQQQQVAVAETEQQASTRRETDRQQFDDRARSDQEQIDGRYTQAERDAQQEIQHGEQRAEAERGRAERESENQSWWEAALDFITNLFDALVSLINDIFQAVRSAVNAILDAVRDFALNLIQLAANFLKGLVEAFGNFLKGLVRTLLADIFPGLARRLIAFIDEAVAFASRAIDVVANGLRSAVNAIVEGLRAGLNAIINLYQSAVNAALSLARAALTGDWGAFILQLLEAACRVAGIDPQQIYAFIGRAQETIQLILNNPGGFLSNVLEALMGGFRRFAGNFLTHLQAGIIGWLTGALGSAGIQLPERFDLIGVISLVAQILGLTWQNLRQRMVRLIGERGVQVLEFVAGYVQTLIQGGMSALWERIQNDLSTLRDMVLEGIRNFLVERVIMAAVTRLATMFNPVGALVNLLITIYNVYTFIRDQLQRIIQVVQTVVDAISNIARGVLGPASERIESFLAGLLPLAIDLLARILGLGNVGERVRAILQRVQDTIWRAIDRLIERVVGMFRGRSGAAQPAGASAAAVPGGAAIGERIAFSVAGEAHALYIQRNPRGGADPIVASAPLAVEQRLNRWDQEKNNRSDQRAPNETESPRAKAIRLIPVARQELGQVDQLADALARQGAASPRPGAAPAPAVPAASASPAGANQQSVTQEEHQLANVLQQLFVVFEEVPAQGGSLAQRFTGNLAAAHPEVQRGLQVALQALERSLQGGQNAAQLYPGWDSVRTAMGNPDSFRSGAEGRGFASFVQRPLNTGTSPLAGGFPQAALALALSGLQQQITRSPSPPTNLDANAHANGQKALIHDQRPPYQRSLLAVRALIWDARAQGAAERTLGEELFAAATSQARVDPDLQAAVQQAGIIEFLKTMAAGGTVNGINHARLAALQNDAASWNWLKDRFRRERPGNHEWIPTNMMVEVVNRAQTVQTLEEGAKWIDLHHRLRSDTSWVIFTLTYARQQGTLNGASYDVMQGHPGALYIIEGGELDGRLVPQTFRSGEWHEQLRANFRANMTVASVLDALQQFFRETVWESGLPSNIYPEHRNSGGAIINMGRLASQQSRRYRQMYLLFYRLRDQLG